MAKFSAYKTALKEIVEDNVFAIYELGQNPKSRYNGNDVINKMAREFHLRFSEINRRSRRITKWQWGCFTSLGDFVEFTIHTNGIITVKIN